MEKSEYLTREECIEKLVNDCNIRKIHNCYYPTKGSSSLYTAQKSLQKSINYHTQNLKDPKNNGERWYCLLHNIKETPKCFCGKNRQFITTSKGYTEGCGRQHSNIIITYNENKYFEYFKEDFSILLTRSNIRKLYSLDKEKDCMSMFTKSKLFKHKVLLNSLLFYTEHLIPINYNNIEDKQILKERLYIVLNNIQNIPICKTDGCNNKCNFKSLKDGHYSHCSLGCINKDKEVRKVIHNTLMITQGEDYFRNIALLQNNKTPEQKQEAVKKRELYYMENHGCKNAFQVPEFKIKSSETLYERTGYHHNSYNPDTIERRKDTHFIKTGYYHHSHNPYSKCYNIGSKTEVHSHCSGIYYHSSNEKWFLDLMVDVNLGKYVYTGVSIKYKHNKIRHYITDYTIKFPNNIYIVEIKANHVYFYKDLFNGTLFAKWTAAENYCEMNNYKGYIFIMNNEIMTKDEIIAKYMIPIFNECYPFI